MNMWMVAATALLIGLVPCGWVIIRSDTMSRLVGLEMAGTVCALILMLMAQGARQPSYFDLALAFALLAYPAGMVFANLLERWL